MNKKEIDGWKKHSGDKRCAKFKKIFVNLTLIPDLSGRQGMNLKEEEMEIKKKRNSH